MKHAVDFDATLAHYTEWKGQLVLGAPVPPMVERVKAWLAAGDEVYIYTARVNNDPAFCDVGTERTTAAIQAWCLEHIGRSLEVVPKAMFADLWDDRARQVLPNTGLSVLDVIRRRQAEENAAGKTYACSVLREVAEEIERLTNR